MKTHSIEELIKFEQKSRQMALALERKAEYFRSQANKYLEMLKKIERRKKCTL